MGLRPAELVVDFRIALRSACLAIGANCGVGRAIILGIILAMTEARPDRTHIAKGNCGVPQFRGVEIVYSGTPTLMGDYAALAVDAALASSVGAVAPRLRTSHQCRVIKRTLAGDTAGERPTLEQVVAKIGPLTNAAPGGPAPEEHTFAAAISNE